MFLGHDVANYVEPFFGSGAMLLARPGGPGKYEAVNDLNRFICNFWRAVKAAPEQVAHYADWPVNETDLESRHYWLVTEGANKLASIMGDPDAYDAKVAGWWVWGACSWIGSGWCAGTGPWSWDAQDGWTKAHKATNNVAGISRQLPVVSWPTCINAGIKSEAVRSEFIMDWMQRLSDRLRHVRVACGDWARVLGSSPTTNLGTTAVFLDPPYSHIGRSKVYSDDNDVTDAVRAWCVEKGSDPKLRIALCGYEGEHDALDGIGWKSWRWKAGGGYGNIASGVGKANSSRETIWFSPHCLQV